MSASLFRGGIHPPARKELAREAPLTPGPIPSRAVIHFSQHIGSPAKPVVSVGDKVKAGQLIGEPAGFVSVAVHATISGTVTEILRRMHPSGRPSLACIIEADGRDEWIDLEAREALRTQEEICAMLRTAGIVGLGGATFPTHVKLSPPESKRIDLLIVNGAECEPYLTADERLMIEKPEAVLKGAKFFARALSASQGVIAVEDNKPKAIESMQRATLSDPVFKVRKIPTKYPQGAEKQLIQALTGRVVPSGGFPMDVGVVVQNVGTAFAAFEAGHFGKPLVERVITVTGEGVERPANLVVRLGTPIQDLLDHCGVKRRKKWKVICGGPMMGVAQWDLQVPVIKGTSGLLVLPKEVLPDVREMPCIRCGRCVQSCPIHLVPCELGELAQAERYEEADRYGVNDCIECGCCTFICPSRRPLVQLIRKAKQKLRERAPRKAASS